MLSTLRNAWKIPELRKRLLFTVLMVLVYRMANHIPVPGIDTSKLVNLSQNGTLFGFYDLISGGAFSRFSIVAMGVTPYINASIVLQLLTVAIPYLEQLSKEGEDGRKKIQNYTRYAAIGFGLLQAFGTYILIYNAGAIKDASNLNVFLIILTTTTASIFLMWLGDQITVRGIGNGVSLLIFVNIVSRYPAQFYQVAQLQKAQQVTIVGLVMFIAVIIALFIGVLMTSLAERRISVQYAGKVVGNRTFKGQTTHIPININSASVIAIIFAMSVMGFPGTIAAYRPTSAFSRFINTSPYSVFRQNSWSYLVIYFLLTIFFTWFYTQVTFKPDEMAENMHKSSGFIPGIRPGEPTARYIERVLGRVAILGGIFAGVIATFPYILEGYTNFKGIQFGGTSMLILIGVALDTMRQIESQLVMRHYQGFLK